MTYYDYKNMLYVMGDHHPTELLEGAQLIKNQRLPLYWLLLSDLGGRLLLLGTE